MIFRRILHLITVTPYVCGNKVLPPSILCFVEFIASLISSCIHVGHALIVLIRDADGGQNICADLPLSTCLTTASETALAGRMAALAASSAGFQSAMSGVAAHIGWTMVVLMQRPLA